MSSAPEELRLSVPGLELAARAHGPADGPRVLALHGWLDSAASFDRLAPLLPGLRLVALDLPGHGRSDHRPAGARYHFVDWPLDVAAAVAALGWDRFVLMGHSMGAGVASLLAASLGERVLRLVLLDGLAPGMTEPADAPARLATAITEHLAPAPAARRYASFEEAAQRFARARSELTEAGAAALAPRAIRVDEGGASFASDPRLRGTSPLRLSRAHVEAFLARIRCPSLLVRPAAGMPIPEEAFAALTALVPDLRVAHVPGGHHAHLDDPAPTAAAIRDFLAS